MPSPKHDQLTGVGARWLKRNGFPVVTTELTCQYSRERPDVIGFRSTCSAIIEVKVSRADFLADAKKPERGAGGLGVYRFYLCPEGMISPDEIPQGWYFLEAKGQRVTPIIAPQNNLWPGLDDTPENIGTWASFRHSPNHRAERSALFSIARRLS